MTPHGLDEEHGKVLMDSVLCAIKEHIQLTCHVKHKAEWRNNEGKHQHQQEGPCIVMSQREREVRSGWCYLVLRVQLVVVLMMELMLICRAHGQHVWS